MSGVFVSQMLTDKYMPQMSAARCARYLGSHAIGVERFRNCALNLVIEAWPATVRLEFVG